MDTSAARNSGDPDGNAKISKDRQPVSAHAEKCDVAQGKLSCVAAHKIPGEPESGEQRNAEEHLKLVIVVDEPGHARPHQHNDETKPRISSFSRGSCALPPKDAGGFE